MAGKSREGALSDLLRNLGLRLRNARLKANLTQETAARQAGVSSQTLRNWESGRHEPTRRNLNRLAEIYRVTLDQLLQNFGFGEFHSFISVPIRGYLLAGSNEHPNAVQMGSIPMPEEVLRDHPGIFALLVSGDSLANTGIRDGDMLLVDPQGEIEDESIQIVRQGDLLFARFAKTVNGDLQLKPDQISTESVDVDATDLVGRVVWHVRKV